MHSKILEILNNKIYITGLIIVFVCLFAFRLSSLYLYFFVPTNELFVMGAVNVITSVLFCFTYAGLYHFFWGQKQKFISSDKYKITRNFFGYTVLLFIALRFSSMGIENAAQSEWAKESLLLALLYAIMAIFTGVHIIRIVAYLQKLVLMTHKGNYVQSILIMRVCIMLILALFYTNFFLDLSYVFWKGIINIAVACILIFIFIFTIFLTGNNAWISELAPRQKLLLIFFTVLCGFASLYFIGQTFDKESFLYRIMEGFLTGSAIYFRIILLILLAYSLRFFFSVLSTLPTGSILKQKSDELASLQTLNQLVAESINQSDTHLLAAVVNLSYQSSGAIAAWAELYDETELQLISMKNINSEMILDFHSNGELQNIFTSFKEPYHFASIRQTKGLHLLFKNYPFEDMLLLPLYERDKRIGSIVALHLQENGFSNDVIKLLKAYSNNLKIAFENQQLLKDNVEKERLKNELMLARDMQAKIIPQVLPKANRFDVAAYFMPAVEVGGDYYDMFKLKDGRYCVLSADVSGKGMTAAFYVAQLKGVVLSLASISGSPSDLLKNINQALYGAMERSMFITITAFAFDENSDVVSFARAGHSPVYLYINGKTIISKPVGMGIGLANKNIFNRTIEEVTMDFPVGSRCLLVSDGILELRNEEHNDFGEARLIEVIATEELSSAENLVTRVKNVTKEFQGIMPLHDDSTVVAIINKG